VPTQIRVCNNDITRNKLSTGLIACFLFVIIIGLALGKPAYGIQENLVLSNPGVPSFLAQVVTVPGKANVYAAWSGQLEDGYSDIFLSASTDGINFGEPKNVSSTPGADSLNVQLVGLGTSNVYVVWQDSTADSPGILFANSTDSGNSFGTDASKPISVSGNSFFADSPQIAVTNSGDVYVVWHDNVDGNDEIFFAAKPHDQNSFGSAKNVSNSPTGLSANPQIGIFGTGNIFVSWEEYSGDSAPEIVISSSADAGNAFGCSLNLSSNNGYSTNPQIGISDSARVYLTWQDSSSGTAEILLQRDLDPLATTITLDPISNTSPKWGIDVIQASGGVHAALPGSTVTVEWGDGNTTTGIPVSGCSWGPVSHPNGGSYSSDALAINPNHVKVKLIAADGATVTATSLTTDINVQKHATALGLNQIASVKHNTTIAVKGILTDLDNGGTPVGGKTITFEGTGAAGLGSVNTNLVNGSFSATGPATSEIGEGFTVKARFNATGNDPYASSESEVRTYITTEAPPLEFNIDAGLNKSLNLTGLNVSASISFEEINTGGRVVASDCESPATGTRYASFTSGATICLAISSDVEMATGSEANVTLSFAGQVPPAGLSEDVDIFHIKHNSETATDEVVDVTRSRDMIGKTVTGTVTSFSKFVVAPALHLAKPEGSYRQDVFIGDSNIVSLRNISSTQVPAIIASFDRSEYLAGDKPILTISDANRNLNPSEKEIIRAGVRSNSSIPFYVIITLTETSADSGIFQGTFTLTSAETNDLFDLLHIEAGDTLEALYIEGARFSAKIDGVTEAGIVETKDVIPLVDCFTFVGGAVNLKFVDSHLGPNGNITVSISYRNAGFQPEDIAKKSDLKIIYSNESTTGIVGRWDIIPSTVHTDTQIVTGIVPLPSDPSALATYSGGSFSLAFDTGCRGGAGGGFARPGAGIVVDFIASIKKPTASASPTNAGGGGTPVLLQLTHPGEYFLINPLARFSVEPVAILNAGGGSSSGQVRTGERITIGSTIANHQSGVAQHYAWLVQITDKSGIAVGLERQEGSLEPGQSASVSVAWTAAVEPGVYSIKIFTWDGIGNSPSPLSDVNANNLMVKAS